jgi:hypothetical protein
LLFSKNQELYKDDDVKLAIVTLVLFLNDSAVIKILELNLKSIDIKANKIFTIFIFIYNIIEGSYFGTISLCKTKVSVLFI